MPKNTALSAYKAGVRSRTKRGGGGRAKFNIPLAVVAGFIPLGVSLWNAKDGGGTAIMDTLSKRMTGYSPSTAKWNPADMKCGTFSILGGFLVHWLVGSKLGVNRMLARSGVPLIRI